MRSLIAAAALTGCSPSHSSPTVRIAAAADLADAFEAIGSAFQRATGIAPVFTFDSSSLLAKRIDEGAPYALFAAANRAYAADTVDHGRCDPASLRPYAQGFIVVWTPSGAPAPAQLADLADPKYARIAIADPEHAPYGKAAKQALETAGLWEQLAPKIKYGGNVEATLELAKTHAVDAAIVARALAVRTDDGARLEIDQGLYDPLEQYLVICAAGPERDRAQRFAEYIASEEGRQALEHFGFAVPANAGRR